MKKRKTAMPLIIIALIFLSNPNMNIIDILPDCLTYFILSRLIGRSSEIVPYLAECKESLNKLTLVTLIKIPAFMIMFANMRTGRDIITLFTFTFSVIEVILLCSAISYGFKGMNYLGERSELKSLIDQRSDGMRIMTYIFVIAKAVLSTLPEFCLLTSSDALKVRRMSNIYPLLELSCIATVMVIGIIWLVSAIRFAKSVRGNGDIAGAVTALAGEKRLEEIERKAEYKKRLSLVNVLMISSLFTFDLIFENYNYVNILPHFIYGIILLWVAAGMSENKKYRRAAVISGGAYIVLSMLTQIFTIHFFDKYSYLALEFAKKARSAYLWVEIFAVLETMALIALLICCVYIFRDFVKTSTGLSAADVEQSITEKAHRRKLTAKGTAVFIISGVIAMLKALSTVLRAGTTHGFGYETAELVPEFPLPWLSTVIFFITLIFVIYTFYSMSELKGDVRMKYEDDKKHFYDTE